MSFIHPLLLGGLLLVAIPVLLHLIMRQQPKHLLFPAVRFLMQKQKTNQRKLQLRHLFLLALRMLLIAAICLALARPKVFSERLNLSGDRPVAAVLVFDTSYSMEYMAGRRSRLDEAKERGLELLQSLPDGSRLAVLDTAETGEDWLPSAAEASDRIKNLQLRAANYPITTQLAHAYDLLAKIGQEQDNPSEAFSPFLYVFSDRGQACWEVPHLKNLQGLRDRIAAPGVNAVFVDVGADKPADLAIRKLALPRQIVPANKAVIIRAEVGATSTSCDQEIICRIDGQAVADRKPVKLEAGQSTVISFERGGLSPGWHQAEVTLATTDNMPFDNSRSATFEVRGPRQVLVITDQVQRDNKEYWAMALDSAPNGFTCDVKSTDDSRSLGPNDLAKYQAICMLNLANPSPDLWEKLERYVQNGGGLAIMPGGDLRRDAYNSNAARALMPAKLVEVVKAEQNADKQGAIWNQGTYQHAIMAPLRDWSINGNVEFLQPGKEPAAFRYWKVEPFADESFVIVSYDDAKNQIEQKPPPALVERQFDRKKIRGRVILFTTPIDKSHLYPPQGAWSNYLQAPRDLFFLYLADKTVGYLAGDAEDAKFNHESGQTVRVPLPANSRFPSYTLQGPGLSGSDTGVLRAGEQNALYITQAVAPGNYQVLDGDGKLIAAFSLNIQPDECLLNKVPPEQIEALFGPNALLPIDAKTNLQAALQGHWNQPVELMPWLMILLLVFLAVENLLANKFYKSTRGEGDTETRRNIAASPGRSVAASLPVGGNA